MNEIIGLIEKSERPVLYVGGGIISAEAHEELRAFAQLTGIPVTSTIMGCGAFPENDPLSLRWLGVRCSLCQLGRQWRMEERSVAADGSVSNNEIHPGADLLLALRCALMIPAMRVTGKVEKFCEKGTIVHVDIDESGKLQ